MRAAAPALEALARATPVAAGADLAATHAELVGELLAGVAGVLAARRGLPPERVTGLLAGGDAPPASTRAAREAALAPLRAEAEAIAEGDPHAVERLGAAYEATTATALERDDAGRLRLVGGDRRRRGGCHYTAPTLAARIVEVALAPLVAAGADPLALRVVDPAMGSGACLLAALRWLAARAPSASDPRRVRRELAARSLAGLDVDPMAVRVARASLWLEVGDPELDVAAVAPGLRVADGLVDEAERGADAFVGNPPWVSYVGRAAQPLDPATRARFVARFAAFAGYRNLQGLFVEQAASLLRPGGRLALLVPSSMAEQQGYAPTRRALHAHGDVDPVLVDVGEDAFDGVFQPCMIVAATRRAAGAGGPVAAWPVERPDLDDEQRALLERLAALPPLPAETFGERGVQTGGDDVADLSPVPDARRTMPLRAGGDIEAFVLRPPARWADPARFPARFRSAAWGEVAVVVRQTAAWPIAARSDGLPFRNSLLAAFAGAGLPADLLVAWLNASPVRWHHHMRFRDARQGMPQVKVGHLRAVPAPRPGPALAALEAMGAALSRENRGVDEVQQDAIDAAASDALGLDARDRALVAAWRRAKTRSRA